MLVVFVIPREADGFLDVQGMLECHLGEFLYLTRDTNCFFYV
jgi:hypothetical protein